MKSDTHKRLPATHLIGVWLVVFGAYALTLAGYMCSPDDEVLFRVTESIATSGTLGIAPIMEGFASKTGKNGLDYAQYGIGQPILAAPLYRVGEALEKVYSGTGLKPPYRIVEMQYHDRSDSAWVRRFAVSWFNVLLGATFATVFFAFVFTLTGEASTAWLTAALYALGTMAWPHSRTFFSEPLAAFCVLCGFALLCQSARAGRILPAFAAGCFSGYAMLTRLDSVLAFPGLAVFLALWHTRQTGRVGQWFRAQFRREALARWLAWGAPIVVAFALYATLNLIHFGTIKPAYADQSEGINFGTPIWVGLHGFLCSIGKGLFFFSPPLFLFFWSMRKFIQREPALGWGIAVSIVCFLGVQSCWINWAGGWCWGPRHIFMIHWMLALPIAALLRPPRAAGIRIAYTILMLLGVTTQVYGSSVSFCKYYRTFFFNVLSEPRAMALYDPKQEDYLEYQYVLKYRPSPDAEPVEPTRNYFRVLVAPINDSIYIYQNSQWPGNAQLLARGLHDLYWLHLVAARSRPKPPDLLQAPVGAPAEGRASED